MTIEPLVELYILFYGMSMVNGTKTVSVACFRNLEWFNPVPVMTLVIITVRYCSAWPKSKLNTKIGLHTTTTTTHPPPTTNFSPRRGCRKVPKFYVGTWLTKILGFQPKKNGAPPPFFSKKKRKVLKTAWNGEKIDQKFVQYFIFNFKV